MNESKELSGLSVLLNIWFLFFLPLHGVLEISPAFWSLASSTTSWNREEIVPASSLCKEASLPKSSQNTLLHLLLTWIGSCAHSRAKHCDQEMGFVLINSEPCAHSYNQTWRHGLPSTLGGDGLCAHQKKGKWMLGRHHNAHYTSQTLQSHRGYIHIPESTFPEHNMKAYPAPPDDFTTWWPWFMKSEIWSLIVCISINYQESLLHTNLWGPLYWLYCKLLGDSFINSCILSTHSNLLPAAQ